MTMIYDLQPNSRTSQMYYLFYNQLGGLEAGQYITATDNSNYNLFTNVQKSVYWAGSEVTYADTYYWEGETYFWGSYSINPDYAWDFDTSDGYQGYYGKHYQLYAWAVRPGDVAAVPVPGAFWLFGSALVGLMGLKRRGNIG